MVELRRVSLPGLYTLENLHRAVVKCSARTRWKGQVQRFLLHELTEIVGLREQVLSGTWEPRRQRPFTKVERGKPRIITPRDMRTRVVEQVLCSEVLEPLVVSEVVDGCSACITGRGLSYAHRCVRAMLGEAGPDGWLVQYDFHDHFGLMSRTRALDELGDMLPPDVVDLVSRSIGGPGVGFDLGSNVSQHLGTWYPTPLDRAMLALPGVVGYHRHMDDGLVALAGRDEAFAAMEALRSEVAALGLELNPRKTHVNRATHPHVYCGMRFTVTRSGRVKANLPKAKTRTNVRHVRRVVACAGDRGIDVAPVMAASAGYLDSGDATLSPRLLAGISPAPSGEDGV